MKKIALFYIYVHINDNKKDIQGLWWCKNAQVITLLNLFLLCRLTLYIMNVP